MEALDLLREAAKKVPVVNYAFGVAGVGAAIFIIWFLSRTGGFNVVLGLAVMLFAMVILFVFAASSTLPGPYKRYVYLSGIMLVVSTTLIFCAGLILSLTALAFLWPDGLVTTLRASQRVEHKPGAWIHPGGAGYSDMKFERVSPTSFKFSYLKPRAGMIEEGVERGDLFFDGSIENGHYSGNARIYKRGCPPLSFAVSGKVQNSDFIILDGYMRQFETDGCNASAKAEITQLIFLRTED